MYIWKARKREIMATFNCCHRSPKFFYVIILVWGSYFYLLGHIKSSLTTSLSTKVPDSPDRFQSNNDGGKIDRKTAVDIVPKLRKFNNIRNGTCSKETWDLGYHQKIISYSFKKSNLTGYWEHFNETLSSLQEFYPGWNVRVYGNQDDLDFLRSKVTLYDYLFFCNIQCLPSPLNKGDAYPVTMWRFAPMGDPQVDVLMIRDTDSQLLQREVDAVEEWLYRTNKTLHVMRDHPMHGYRILGGLWGIRLNADNKEKITEMRDMMFDLAYHKENTEIDQMLLRKIVYERLKNDVLAHDSYLCCFYKESSPWPTQRSEEGFFVGSAFYRDKMLKIIHSKCPTICRPENHQDWEYC